MIIRGFTRKGVLHLDNNAFRSRSYGLRWRVSSCSKWPETSDMLYSGFFLLSGTGRTGRTDASAIKYRQDITSARSIILNM